MVKHEVISRQRHEVQELDLMAWMAEMMKDLQQEIYLLKEGRTQEIRDNAPPMVNQERAQPEGGLAVEGETNPQYLTLADVNALLEQERRSSSRSPSSSLLWSTKKGPSQKKGQQ